MKHAASEWNGQSEIRPTQASLCRRSGTPWFLTCITLENGLEWSLRLSQGSNLVPDTSLPVLLYGRAADEPVPSRKGSGPC